MSARLGHALRAPPHQSRAVDGVAHCKGSSKLGIVWIDSGVVWIETVGHLWNPGLNLGCNSALRVVSRRWCRRCSGPTKLASASYRLYVALHALLAVVEQKYMPSAPHPAQYHRLLLSSIKVPSSTAAGQPEPGRTQPTHTHPRRSSTVPCSTLPAPPAARWCRVPRLARPCNRCCHTGQTGRGTAPPPRQSDPMPPWFTTPHTSGIYTRPHYCAALLSFSSSSASSRCFLRIFSSSLLSLAIFFATSFSASLRASFSICFLMASSRDG